MDGFTQLIDLSVDVSMLRPNRLKGLITALQDFSPALRRCAIEVLIPSFKKNFDVAGRPKWQFKGYQSPKPMIQSGTLYRVAGNYLQMLPYMKIEKTRLSVRAPSPLPSARHRGRLRPYPRAHQRGIYVYQGYRHPFIMAQKEDIVRMQQIINEHVFGKRRR